MINLVAKSVFSPPARWGSLDFNRSATHSSTASLRSMIFPAILHGSRDPYKIASDFTISTPPFIDDYRWFSLIFTSNNFQVSYVSCFFSHQNLQILHGIHGKNGGNHRHGHAEVRLLRPPNPGLGRNLGEVPGPGAAGRLALPSRGATKNVGISPRKIHGMQGGITSSWKVGM